MPDTAGGIAGLLHAALNSVPDAPAVIYRNAEVSHLMLAAAAHRLQTRFSSLGITRGTRIGLTLAPSPVFLATLLALARLGACGVPLSVSRPMAQRLTLARKFGIQGLIADDPAQALAGWPLVQVGDIGVDARDLEAARAAAASGDAGNDMAGLPWFVALSSGTTDDPKGVGLTQAQAWTRIRQSALPWDRETRVIPYEMSLGAGLFPALRTLAAGGTVIVAEDSDFQAGFGSFVARHGGTHLLMSPWMASQLADQLAGRTHAMPSVRHLWIAGGHCPRDVLQALIERATPHVWLKYASVETGVVAAVPAREALATPGLSGRLGDWVEARVLDESGRLLDHGQSGLLSFRSQGWPTGYLVAQDNADPAFRDGWYCSKDYGRLGPDRELYVEGRSEGAINIAGVRIQPEFLEQALGEKLGVHECAVFELLQPDGATHLAVAVTATDAGQAGAIEMLLAGMLGAIPGLTVQVLTVAHIPRTRMGKALRRVLKQQFTARP
jgi:long-chain acyl-CoA synthetase